MPVMGVYLKYFLLLQSISGKSSREDNVLPVIVVHMILVVILQLL